MVRKRWLGRLEDLFIRNPLGFATLALVLVAAVVAVLLIVIDVA
jgi:hypothetical protein